MTKVSVYEACTRQFNLRKLGVTLTPDLFEGALVMVKPLLLGLIGATDITAAVHLVEQILISSSHDKRLRAAIDPSVQEHTASKDFVTMESSTVSADTNSISEDYLLLFEHIIKLLLFLSTYDGKLLSDFRCVANV
jgi:type IV secretory pathway VirB3-like protein